MPNRSKLRVDENGNTLIQLYPLVKRIQRRLVRQHSIDTPLPGLEFTFDQSEKNYYMVTIGGEEHGKRYGPYFFDHLVDLARYLYVLTIEERLLRKKLKVVDSAGRIYYQMPLPNDLKFPLRRELEDEDVAAMLETG